jgi:TRAP transporter TAXI family solute receptor
VTGARLHPDASTVQLDDLSGDREAQSGAAQDVETAAVVNFLVTREGLSADTVYVMTKAIFDNLSQLAQTHPAAREISVKDAATGMALPLHAGAERYYREIGLLR